MNSLKIFQIILLVTFLSIEYGYNGLYVIPLDFFAVLVFSITWLFNESEHEVKYRISNSVFFGCAFAILLGYGLNPTASQLERIELYQAYNEGFQIVLDNNFKGAKPENYIHASRLISELNFKGFAVEPPAPLELRLEQLE